jgi:hypothetical protein
MTRTYTLLDIWQQAIEDNVSVDMSYGNKQAYIYKGIKVVKVRDEIKILNTRTFGLEYEEIEEYLYDSFLNNGFRPGVVDVLKKSYLDRIEALNKSIKEEINSRNNKKHYKSMKIKRSELINKYSKISKTKRL